MNRLVKNIFTVGLLLGSITAASAQTTPFSPSNVVITGGTVSGANVTATGGTTPRPLSNMAADVVNIISQGAKADGTTNDGPIMLSAASLAASQGKEFFLPMSLSSYFLSSGAKVTAGNYSINIDAGATFTQTGSSYLMMDNLIPYQSTPIWSQKLFSKNYGPDYNIYTNIFTDATVVTNSGTSGNAVVAKFGEGISTIAGNSAWGGNFVGVATVPGANAFAMEADAVNLGDITSNVKAVSANCAGTAACNSALYIQANTASSPFGNGIVFPSCRGSSCFNSIQNAMLLAAQPTTGSVSTGYGIHLGFWRFTAAEILTPSFKVGPTATGGSADYVQIDGSSAGANSFVKVSAKGTDTDVGLNLLSQGSAVIKMGSGFGNAFQVNNAGFTTVNFISVSPSASGSSPILGFTGTDLNVNGSIRTQGAGLMTFGNSLTTPYLVIDPGSNSPVNYPSFVASTTGSAVQFKTSGVDTDIDLSIAPKGAGRFVVQNGLQVGPTATGGSANYVQIDGGAVASNNVTISAKGTDTNVGLRLFSQGTSSVTIGNSFGASFTVIPASTTVANSVQVNPAATGGQPLFLFTGTDTNVTGGIRTKGTGGLVFGNSGSGVFMTINPGSASPVNYPGFSASPAGNAIVMTANGTDANITNKLAGKGTNGVQYGIFTTTADPNTTDIPTGFCADWNNTTAATFKHVCNFGGVLKSVTMN